ncbi:hypothetical protein LCGC14_0667230 [marine sediment metagenome]|uniref:HD domain-containing protein n=1 Tax=marine sediment metagenome TaxID=412755 RepID=A0A0F9TDF8_9ZZZZ
MNIFEKVKEIINPVYACGGCVRDVFLGKIPNDYDFATPLTPDEIEAKVKASGRRAYLTGKRYGTIGFKLDGEFIEVTTFRSEKYIKGSRKPQVEFVKNITHDLSRRDFTINAIATRGKRILDPFNGRKDLRLGKIRAVGTASHRFREDPLRMLRACRFASQLGFNIEDITLKAIEKLNYKILEVSKERWMAELDKLLLGADVIFGLDYMMITGLFRYIIPELFLQYQYNQNSCYHALDLWTHTCFVVRDTPKDINLRWSALLHDIGKPFTRKRNIKTGYDNYVKHELVGADIIERLARHLRWSNERRKAVVELVANHLRDDSPLKKADDKAKRSLV